MTLVIAWRISMMTVDIVSSVRPTRGVERAQEKRDSLRHRSSGSALQLDLRSGVCAADPRSGAGLFPAEGRGSRGDDPLRWVRGLPAGLAEGTETDDRWSRHGPAPA